MHPVQRIGKKIRPISRLATFNMAFCGLHRNALWWFWVVLAWVQPTQILGVLQISDRRLLPSSLSKFPSCCKFSPFLSQSYFLLYEGSKFYEGCWVSYLCDNSLGLNINKKQLGHENARNNLTDRWVTLKAKVHKKVSVFFFKCTKTHFCDR